MENIETKLQEHILTYCQSKDISIDLRFACFGDSNKFYTHDADFALDCVAYYADDFEDIKMFFMHYIDAMWERRYQMNRIALYIEDIVDMDGWYDVIVGGGLFEDDAIVLEEEVI